MEIRKYSDNEKIKIDKDNYNFYVCGPTVYDDIHIGNLRSILVIDILANALKMSGKSVNLVNNLTDIDDKIIKKASEENISEREISEKYIRNYLEIISLMNVKNINFLPKVTENITGIIEFIEKMISNGTAYISNGDVYFDTKSSDSYGEGFRLSINDLDSEDSEFKNNPGDFALWKNTTEGVKYDSPWSEGRPGWHTECAFFVEKYFTGEQLDLHSGGIDLRFPHHTNEDAQYKSIYGKSISKAFSYVGQVSLDGEKMSKSIGNIFKVKDFINQYDTSVLRTLLISSKYSKPINVDENSINNSVKYFDRIKNVIYKSVQALLSSDILFQYDPKTNIDESINYVLDDMNIVKVLDQISAIVKELNKSEISEISEKLNKLLSVLKLLGYRIDILLNDESLRSFNKVSDEGNEEEMKKFLLGVIYNG